MENKTPPDLLTIQDGGLTRELLMSFGLLHELLSEVKDLVRVGLIAIDPELRVSILVSVLSSRDPKGKIIEPLNIFNMNISTADVQRVIKWVQEHLLDFFLGAIESATAAHQPHLDRLHATTSMHSGSGSQV